MPKRSNAKGSKNRKVRNAFKLRSKFKPAREHKILPGSRRANQGRMLGTEERLAPEKTQSGQSGVPNTTNSRVINNSTSRDVAHNFRSCYISLTRLAPSYYFPEPERKESSPAQNLVAHEPKQAEAQVNVTQSVQTNIAEKRSWLPWKKVALAVIPGFFGVMGLGQLVERRFARAAVYFLAGFEVSLFSSWYNFCFDKIMLILRGQPFGTLNFVSDVYTLSAFLIIMGVWGLQVFDASVPIIPNYVPKPGQLPPLTMLNRTLAKKLKVSNSKVGILK
jgi:hypothetical protein